MAMSLGTKFVLLIAGTVVVPIVAVLLMVVVVFAILPDQTGFAADIRTTGAIHSLRRRLVDPADISRLIRSASPSLDVLVFDHQGTLLSSSLRSDSLTEILSNGAGSQILTFTKFAMRAPDGAPYSIVIGVPGRNAEEASWRRFTPTVILLSVLGFVTLMSAFIIRSINASIARLQVGTQRISDGDLDFELKARGNDRIAFLTRSFERMRRRVREETATRSRFIMAVSHDLKTPLSSITGYLDAIGDGIASDPALLQKYLSIIRDKAGLLESRISQLIDYVKLDTADWRRSRESIPLAVFLNEAITVFRTEAEARGFGFDSSIDLDPDTTVVMDGDLVYRALENLMQNAFRYGEPSSTIAFRAIAEGGGRITLQITNRGKVIPPEDLPFIFEPFFRGTRARREGGFGLGLSVVKSVVSSHGWSIAAASHDGETSFTVAIPPGEDASSRSADNKR
jgi:signal transduction histidine kinase